MEEIIDIREKYLKTNKLRETRANKDGVTLLMILKLGLKECSTCKMYDETQNMEEISSDKYKCTICEEKAIRYGSTIQIEKIEPITHSITYTKRNEQYSQRIQTREQPKRILQKSKEED